MTVEPLNRTPDWFKTAVFYEVLVRAFRDSNADGTGDFRGLVEKLDYLEWLGVAVTTGQPSDEAEALRAIASHLPVAEQPSVTSAANLIEFSSGQRPALATDRLTSDAPLAELLVAAEVYGPTSDPRHRARVLDLFAGTGALGLEALSRGAGYAVFIEESAQGRGLIRTNVETFGLTGRTKIFRRDATALGEAGTMAPFNLVFADPPYGKGLGERALRSAADGGWLAPGALCVVEEAASASFEPGSGFSAIDERGYGETVIRFIEAA